MVFDQRYQWCRAVLLMEPVMDMRFLSGQVGIELGSGEYLVSTRDGNDRAQRWAGASEAL
jgi:hypothetical protein